MCCPFPQSLPLPPYTPRYNHSPASIVSTSRSRVHANLSFWRKESTPHAREIVRWKGTSPLHTQGKAKAVKASKLGQKQCRDITQTLQASKIVRCTDTSPLCKQGRDSIKSGLQCHAARWIPQLSIFAGAKVKKSPL